jgi:nuclear transport factor 2 (NTF2) superfamily protein
MNTPENPRPPFPPFDAETAAKKVRMAEDAWNTRDPERVSLAYTPDSTWRNDAGNWFRSYGNENWEFDGQGFMRRRIASINDLPIQAGDRKFFWSLGRRPDDHPSLSELGL